MGRWNSTSFIGGPITGALDASTTTVVAASFAALPVITNPGDGSQYIAIIIDSEKMRITTHTAASTSVTVTRGTDSTSAATHLDGAVWYPQGLDTFPTDAARSTNDGISGTHCVFTLQNRNNVFIAGSPVSLVFSRPANAETYRVVNVADGEIVASGAVTGSPLNLGSDLACGTYRVHLMRSTYHEWYKTAIGSAKFTVMNADARLPDLPASGGIGADANFDVALHGAFPVGAVRFSQTNAVSPATPIANITADAAIDDLYWMAINDPARPRPPRFCAFPNGGWDTNQTAGVTSTVAALYPDVAELFEGPSNEPSMNATTATRLETFAAAVRAGNPSALVGGPCPVSITSDASALTTFFSLGGLDHIDWLTFHTYNTNNNQIDSTRRAFRALKTSLATYSRQITDPDGAGYLPVMMTEWGYFAQAAGVYHPMRQLRWTTLQYLIQEQEGLPKEHSSIFYDRSHGFWSYPSFHESSDGSLDPLCLAMRVMTLELWGTDPRPTPVVFGEPIDSMLIASNYTRDDGSGVLVMMAQGSSFTVPVYMSGVDEVTVVDWAGNASTIEVVSGVASIPVGTTPVYVRLPIGASATIRPSFYRFGWRATTNGTASGATSNSSKAVDGIVIHDYYGLGANATMATLPGTLDVELTRPQRVDTVVVFGSPAQNTISPPMAFTVSTRTSGAWTERSSVTVDPTVEYDHAAPLNTGCTQWEVYGEEPHQFIVDLGQVVTCDAVRVTVTDGTYGGGTSYQHVTAGGLTNGRTKTAVIQEVAVYCRSNAAHPQVVMQP